MSSTTIVLLPTTTVLTGDLNLCLLNEYSAISRNFMNIMNSHFFRPTITQPTRFTERTATCIDHIWTNVTQHIDSGIFYCDITGHFPIFCRLNSIAKPKDNLVKIEFRDMSLTNKCKFNDLVHSTNWNGLLSGIDDTNHLVLILLTTLDKYYNTCFPIKTKIISTKRYHKPWITSALLKSIKTKHDLYKLVKTNNYDCRAYKRYDNLLGCLLKPARSNYYKNIFDECKRDLKKSLVNNK